MRNRHKFRKRKDTVMTIRELISHILSSVFGSTPNVIKVANKAANDRTKSAGEIAEAERLIARLKAKSVSLAQANEKLLTDAIATATAEQREAEQRRQAENQAAKDETDALIKNLEDAIAAAKATLNDTLGENATRHAAERKAEADAIKVAADELARQQATEQSNS
jgi:hypothetical protein